MRSRLLSQMLIAACLVGLAPAGLLHPPEAAGQPSKVAPSVAAWLEEATVGQRLAVWVFLADKGGGPAGVVEAAVTRAASAFDPAAVERRLRARPERPFDEADLPLFRPYLESIRAEGVSFRAFSRWLNAVSLEGGPAEIERIAALPFVRSIRRVGGSPGGPWTEISEAREPGMATFYQYGYAWTQLNQIQIPDLHNEGYTGEGVKVAIFDTGFWLDHETFDGITVIAEHDFINDDGVTENQPGDPSGQHNHGTMCLSLLAGQSPGKMMGGAFDADYILAKTEDTADEQPVEEDWWIEAVEWADSLGAQVISSSLAYTDWYTYADMDGDTAPITNAADQAVRNGIVVVSAAGNQGATTWRYIGAPADGDSVVSAGSVDSLGIRSSFSSQGPTYDGRIKPTIMAMGQATYVANPVATDAYRRGNGTSFATPLVASGVALIIEKHPEWLPEHVINAVTLTGTNAANPDTLYGWGILQAHDASNYVPGGVALPAAGSRGLRIFPNPCPSGLSFSVGDASGGTLGGLPAAIYDVKGRLIGTVVLPASGQAVVETGALAGAAPGVVFIRIPGQGEAKVLIVR